MSFRNGLARWPARWVWKRISKPKRIEWSMIRCSRFRFCSIQRKSSWKIVVTGSGRCLKWLGCVRWFVWRLELNWIWEWWRDEFQTRGWNSKMLVAWLVIRCFRLADWTTKTIGRLILFDKKGSNAKKIRRKRIEQSTRPNPTVTPNPNVTSCVFFRRRSEGYFLIEVRWWLVIFMGLKIRM